MHYISRKKEHILHLSKLDPKKLWRQILSHKTNENNMITLRDYNSYLKNMYESPNVMNKIQTLSRKEEAFFKRQRVRG
jgi:hypothetical protein